MAPYRKREDRPPPPLDAPTLDAIAIRYVERFQTTRARLVRLLRQKLRARGWQEGQAPPDIEAVADRMVALGYVNDAVFADARARGLQRRGMGAARVRQNLSAYGVGEDAMAEALSGFDGWRAAVDFARRKRLGPFGPPPADQKARARQMAAMARAGHGFDVARRVLDAENAEALDGQAWSEE